MNHFQSVYQTFVKHSVLSVDMCAVRKCQFQYLKPTDRCTSVCVLQQPLLDRACSLQVFIHSLSLQRLVMRSGTLWSSGPVTAPPWLTGHNINQPKQAETVQWAKRHTGFPDCYVWWARWSDAVMSFELMPPGCKCSLTEDWLMLLILLNATASAELNSET